jgi:hypothetical protein
MKKIISLMLCIALMASLGLTALAAPESSDGMTGRLKAITLKVKETLGISDSFTSFSGDLNETGTVSLWSLNWSSDKEQIYVSANENGTVVSYRDSLTGSYQPSGGRIPKLPALGLDDAKSIAEAFLAKVLANGYQSVELKGTSSLDYTGNAVYYLSGSLKLFNIDTPVNVSVSVSTATKQVESFYRSDYGPDYSGVTNPSKATDKAAAAAALKGTLNMKMTYALPGDGTHTARLQYRPAPDGSYVVDAATGKLVDLSELDYGTAYTAESKNMGDTASAPAAGTGLTGVEQTGIDKLQGVLSQSELEKLVRSYPELGLTADYRLRNVNYYTYDNEKKETVVTASLQFTYEPKDDAPKYLSVSMNAKTGKLMSVNGSIIYTDAKDAAPDFKYTDEQTGAVARTFIGKILPDELKQSALAPDYPAVNPGTNVRNYIFYRMHENIAFPENYISVGVDADTGYIVSFYYNWYDYDVTFVPPSGAITADAAAAKFSEGAGTALGYVQVPASLQPSGLLLAYTAADHNVWGVNALTGELLKATSTPDTGLKYDDLDGNPYATVINKLASFGVGFPGGSFKPDAQLTQLDALVLIESTNGRKVVPLTLPGEEDDVYSYAYSMGILTPEEKNPTKTVTRAEFVKYLVSAMGYNEIASLKDIYKPGFKDDASIPAALVGYVAIGKGLGIIQGDNTGRCRPNDTATRVQAAIMLYNCMNRK